MIKKSVFEDELVYGMQRELQGFEKNAGMNNLVQAADYLQAALEIFEETGLTSQADQVLSVLSKIANEKHPICKDCEEPMTKTETGKWKCIPCEGEAEYRGSRRKSHGDEHDARKGKPHKPKNPTKIPHDPHTSGLTPERMVENLKHHGIVFNMADDGKADTLLDVELDDNNLEVTEENPSDKSFEDES